MTFKIVPFDRQGFFLQVAVQHFKIFSVVYETIAIKDGLKKVIPCQNYLHIFEVKRSNKKPVGLENLYHSIAKDFLYNHVLEIIKNVLYFTRKLQSKVAEKKGHPCEKVPAHKSLKPTRRTRAHDRKSSRVPRKVKTSRRPPRRTRRRRRRPARRRRLRTGAGHEHSLTFATFGATPHRNAPRPLSYTATGENSRAQVPRDALHRRRRLWRRSQWTTPCLPDGRHRDPALASSATGVSFAWRALQTFKSNGPRNSIFKKSIRRYERPPSETCPVGLFDRSV